MRVAIACDHVGFGLKAAIVENLEQSDHAVLDLGTHGRDPIDYPTMAKAIAAAVAKNFVDRGILFCANGMGGAIAANRFSGIRATFGADPATVRESREQLDANFLSISAANLAPEAALSLVKEWMSAEFSRDEHAAGALAKIAELTGASALRPAPGRPATSSAAPAAPSSAPAAAPQAAAPAAPAAPSAPATPTPPPPPAPAAAAPAPAPAAVESSQPPVMEPTKASDITAVMKVVASVKDSDIKAIATRVLQFLRNRFPTATGTPREDGFAFTLGDQHVATVVIGRNFVELEAGPDRVSTSKIRDLERLDLLLNLPSITTSFDSIKM